MCLVSVLLGVHPYSAQGLFNQEQQAEVVNVLQQKDPEQKVVNKLESIGIPMSQLNIFEGMILKAMFEEGAAKEGADENSASQSTVSTLHAILPSEHDDLHALRQAPAPSSQEFLTALDLEISTRRRVINEG